MEAYMYLQYLVGELKKRNLEKPMLCRTLIKSILSGTDTLKAVNSFPFHHTTILQQTTLNIFCQKIENLLN